MYHQCTVILKNKIWRRHLVRKKWPEILEENCLWKFNPTDSIIEIMMIDANTKKSQMCIDIYINRTSINSSIFSLDVYAQNKRSLILYPIFYLKKQISIRCRPVIYKKIINFIQNLGCNQHRQTTYLMHIYASNQYYF